MSSSPTEATNALIDVTMPQMGVSVAEGTVVQWRKGSRGSGGRQRDRLRDLDRQDRQRSAGAGLRGRGRDPGRRRRDRACRNGAGTGARRLGVPLRPRAAGASPTARPATPATNGRGGRYSPVVGRIAAEHGIDLSLVTGTGRDGRVRKQDVLAYLEQAGNGGVGNGVAEDPPLHIESPYRPDPALSGDGVGALPRAPADRRAHEALT